MLCLESTDLPDGLDLNAVRVLDADQGVVADGDGTPAVVLEQVRPAAASWPYAAAPGPAAGERVRAALRPYASWGNRGPSTMRVWIPEAE